MPNSKHEKKKWKGKERKKGDVVMDNPRKDDIIIPVMGPTGVGKSTFINVLARHSSTLVGHDLESCTATIQHVAVHHPTDPKRRFVFVDTPGFEDTYVDDLEILRRVAVWLAHSYNDGVKLAGVIYLQEITQKRMRGATHKNHVMFTKLCGHLASQNVVLATTKWGQILEETGLRHEEELKSKFWKGMIDHGSKVARFQDTYESAWRIVDLIDPRSRSSSLIPLYIQEEMVDYQKLIPETDAGHSLCVTLQELVAAHKKTLAQLQNETHTQENEGLQLRLQEIEKQIRSSVVQIKQLEVRLPLGKRILSKLGFVRPGL
ncbi:P-loop containing nucleoside triphosphate hydrolase protein [Suillus ampliporus]|nr:P-loop containing nucleoside triphosphate hydrolase protein [Suillus ampliporus]